MNAIRQVESLALNDAAMRWADVQEAVYKHEADQTIAAYKPFVEGRIGIQDPSLQDSEFRQKVRKTLRQFCADAAKNWSEKKDRNETDKALSDEVFAGYRRVHDILILTHWRGDDALLSKEIDNFAKILTEDSKIVYKQHIEGFENLVGNLGTLAETSLNQCDPRFVQAQAASRKALVSKERTLSLFAHFEMQREVTAGGAASAASVTVSPS